MCLVERLRSCDRHIVCLVERLRSCDRHIVCLVERLRSCDRHIVVLPAEVPTEHPARTSTAVRPRSTDINCVLHKDYGGEQEVDC